MATKKISDTLTVETLEKDAPPDCVVIVTEASTGRTIFNATRGNVLVPADDRQVPAVRGALERALELLTE